VHHRNIPAFQSSRFIDTIVADSNEVLELMQSVDTTKACGYDGSGNRIVKICADGFYIHFTRLINLSFAPGQFPSEWKYAGD